MLKVSCRASKQPDVACSLQQKRNSSFFIYVYCTLLIILPLCSCDCPIFYKRKKVQKDLKDGHDALDRFDW